MISFLTTALSLLSCAFAVDENSELLALTVRPQGCESSSTVFTVYNDRGLMKLSNVGRDDTIDFKLKYGVLTDTVYSLGVDKDGKLAMGTLYPKDDWLLGSYLDLTDSEGRKAFFCNDVNSKEQLYWHSSPASVCMDFIEVELFGVETPEQALPYKLLARVSQCPIYSGLSEARVDDTDHLTIGALVPEAPELFGISNGNLQTLSGKFLSLDDKQRLMVSTAEPGVSAPSLTWGWDIHQMSLNESTNFWACVFSKEALAMSNSISDDGQSFGSNPDYGYLYWSETSNPGEHPNECEQLVPVQIGVRQSENLVQS